ncbi:hypothetical protein C7T94_14130 [Pedobacter yulinensis]|uniref:Uncharacterized protein n=1 Tax=Pedobacter yulinensis TaxID=2126353 RepID=A0A2T3HMK4_9SPHI|nr:hypothetical protein C7T94_14130 [Pedobacter yulinensis]
MSSNPFRKIADNAKKTSKKWVNIKAESTLDTVVCPRCGAPRPVNTNVSSCDYCHYKFMNVEVLVKRNPGSV